MKHFIILIALLVYTTTLQARLSASRPPTAHSAFVFIENKGQIVDQHHAPRSDIDAKLQTNGLSIFVGDGAIHYQWQRELNSKLQVMDHEPQISEIETYRLDVELIGANKNAALLKDKAQQYFETYYLPQCKEGMTAHSYQRLVYQNVYPNIDWVLYVQQGKLKYDFVVRPGGKVSDIQLRYAGATSLIMRNGSIIASSPMGSITEQKPYSYNAETKREVTSAYVLKGNVLSFSTAPTDGTLVIDPILEWGTFFGTATSDHLQGVTADAQGAVYTAGTTNGQSIATIGAHQTTIAGANDAVLAKFNKLGQLVWSTYYGGLEMDNGADVVIDNEGMVYLTGTTSSSGLSTPGAHQEGFSAWGDGYLVKFNGNGQRIWCTYFGGIDNDVPQCLAVDNNNNVFISGRTSSAAAIATPGANQTTYSDDYDAFLAKFDKDGKLNWSTYYGKSKMENAITVACDRKGDVYIACNTETGEHAITPGAYDPSYNGGIDIILVKFSGGGQLLWNTYYGGASSDAPFGLACDEAGDVVMSGQTSSSSGIATPGSHQTFLNATSDCFVAKFSSTGALKWSTYFGGNNYEWYGAVAIDPERNIYLTGGTQSPAGLVFGTVHQPAYGGNPYDAFLAKFDAGGILQSATYLGGQSMDYANDLACNPLGEVFLCGSTHSNDAMATPGAHQPNNAGVFDGFLAKFYDTVAFIKQPYIDTAWCLPRTIAVPYVAQLGFDASNVFTLELSDANGSFASPTVIGSVASNTSGTIPVTLPATLPVGTGYRVRLRASSPAYVSKDNGINIAIAPGITISAADVSAVCTDATVKFTLNNPQAGLSYFWTGPNGYTSTIAEPEITNTQVDASGDYIITATANGCSASDTVTVTVNPKPSIAKMARPEPVCAGGVLRFWAVSAMAGASHQWYGPAGFTSTLERPEIHGATAANSGRYVVLLKSSQGCLSDSIFVNAEVIELKASIKPLRRFEVGDTLAFFGGANADSVTYSWEGPGGFYSDLQNPMIIDVTPPYRGDYFLTVTSKYGCKATTSVHAIVSDLITFNLFPNPNNGRFTIKGNTQEDQVVHMEIVDVAGRSIYRDEVKTFRRHFTKEVDTEGRLANGSYILRLDVAGKTQDVRFAVGR